MNVTYVTAGIVPIHSDLGGGIERHIRAVTTELERRGHSVSIVDRQYSSTDPETYGSIPVTRVSAPRVSTGLLDGWADHVINESIYAALLGRARDELADADIVHAQNMYAGLRAHRIARHNDVPFVYTCGNGMWCAPEVNVYERQVVRRLEGKLAREADVAIAVSEAVADGLRRHADADPTVIPNGVDVDAFHPDVPTAGVVDRYGLADTKTVLFVGRIVEAKGVDVLLQAARDVVETSDDPVEFLVVGPDKHMFGGSGGSDYADELQRLLDETGVRPRFTFTGELPEDELRALYAASDVLVLPSRFEAQGMVLIEAMASGTPVVGSDVGGIPENITDDVGRVVPAEDPAALADAIVDVLDPAVNEELSVAARRRAEDVYAWPRIVDQVESHYQDLV